MDPRGPKFSLPCYFEYLVGLLSFSQPLFSWMTDRTPISHFVLSLLLKVPIRGHLVKLWRGYVRRSGWNRGDYARRSRWKPAFRTLLKTWSRGQVVDMDLCFSFIRRYISSFFRLPVSIRVFSVLHFRMAILFRTFFPSIGGKESRIAQVSMKIKSPAVFKLGYSGTLFPFCHISSSMLSGRAFIPLIHCYHHHRYHIFSWMVYSHHLYDTFYHVLISFSPYGNSSNLWFCMFQI